MSRRIRPIFLQGNIWELSFILKRIIPFPEIIWTLIFNRTLMIVQSNYYRALVMVEEGQNSLAKSLFEKVISLDPSYFTSYLYLADYAFKEKDYERVVDYLNRAEPLEPENSDLYYFRGIAYKELKDNSRAEKDLSKAIELNPKDITAYLQLSIIYDDTDQIEKAEKILKDLIKVEPDSADAYNFLGYLFAERGIRLDESGKTD